MSNVTATEIPSALDLDLRYDESILTDEEKDYVFPDENGLAVLKTDRELFVGVHDGEIHADEAAAVALLNVLLPCRVTVVRTRDKEKLKLVSLRVDVDEGLCDHHGRRFEPGVAAVTRVFCLLRQTLDRVDEVWEKLSYRVDAIARVDSGVKDSPNKYPWVHTAVLREKAQPGMAVGGMGREDEKGLDALFGRIVRRFEDEFDDLVSVADEAHDAKVSALEAIARAEAAGEGVVVFPPEAYLADGKKMMWERKCNALYYIIEESENDYRLLCAAEPDKEFSFMSSRKLVPEKYRGLRDDDLKKATGIDSAKFCHIAGFTAGFSTLDGARAFAKLCLA